MITQYTCPSCGCTSFVGTDSIEIFLDEELKERNKTEMENHERAINAYHKEIANVQKQTIFHNENRSWIKKVLGIDEWYPEDVKQKLNLYYPFSPWLERNLYYIECPVCGGKDHIKK